MPLKAYEEGKEIFYNIKHGSVTDYRRYVRLNPIWVSCTGYIMISNTEKKPYLLEVRGFPPHVIGEDLEWRGRGEDLKYKEKNRGKIKITESKGYGVSFRFFHNHDKKSYELAQIFVREMEKRVRSLKWRSDVFQNHLYKIRGLSDKLMFFLNKVENKSYSGWLDSLIQLSKESPELYQNNIKRNLTDEEKRFLKRVNENGENLRDMLPHPPASERELRKIFDILHPFLGFRILHYTTSFPDYLLLRNGEELRAEAELYASSFRLHKHNPNECDMIICWENNIFPEEIGLDVFEMATGRIHKRDKTIEDIIVSL